MALLSGVNCIFNLLNYFLPLVSGAPTLINVSSDNPTQVCVIFTEAAAINQNGLINSYLFNLTNPELSQPYNRICLITNSSCFTRLSDNSIRICYSGVEDGVVYMVSLRAINGAGLGVASDVIEVMTSGGWFF